MFNSCSACRRRLARRAEGSLPRSQWARLEAHLEVCSHCRRIDEADRALHMALSMTASARPGMPREAANAFDDRVLELVLNQPASRWRMWLESMPGFFRFTQTGGPALFVGQLAGGALVAATISASCLMLTLRPQYARHAELPGPRTETAANLKWLYGPPVPMEALLDTPAPRAAMLWTRPSGAEHLAVARTEQQRNKTKSSSHIYNSDGQLPSHL